MSLASPRNTLAYHGARIMGRSRDISAVSCSQIAGPLKAYLAGPGAARVAPEVDAMWFYGTNHGMALLREARAPLEPLTPFEDALCGLYHGMSGPACVRAVYYLLGICTREFRHLKNAAAVGMEVGAAISKPLGAWIVNADSGGEDTILTRFCNDPPNCTIGEYVRGLVHGYSNGGWNSNYGGKAWANIARCLLRYFEGTYSAETLLDTSFTLSHNCGTIYNKPLIFKSATHNLTQLLDVQRSGQIPAMIVEGYLLKDIVPVELRDCMQALSSHFPGKIGGFVDWYLVEALGSVGKYPEAQAAQVKKHGPSAHSEKIEAMKAAQEAAAKAKAEKAAAEAAAKKAALLKTVVEVMPGQMAVKSQIQRAA